MPLVSVSFHQSCPSFDGIRSIDNTSRQVLLSKEYFLWSSLQRFDKSRLSPLLLMRIWCQFFPSWIPFDWQFSRLARLLFPWVASRPIGNICTHRMRVETIFVGLPSRRSLSLRVSPSRAPVLSCAHYFQATATQAMTFHRTNFALKRIQSANVVSRRAFQTSCICPPCDMMFPCKVLKYQTQKYDIPSSLKGTITYY